MIDAIGKIGVFFFNPVEWAHDSLGYVKDASSSWFPDPRPALVFFALCITSVRLASRTLSAFKSVRGIDILIWGSLFIGFDAMKRAYWEKLFAKSVEKLKEELCIAEQQLEAWEKWYQTAEKDILKFDKRATQIEQVTESLTLEVEGIKEIMLEGKNLFREGKQQELNSSRELGKLIEKKGKLNEAFSSLLNKMSDSTDRQIQELVPSLKKQLAPWDQRINRLERLIEELKEKCFSRLQCPKCQQEFSPVEAIAKRKKK